MITLNVLSLEYIFSSLVILIWMFVIGRITLKTLDRRQYERELRLEKKTSLFPLILWWVFSFVCMFMFAIGYKAPVKNVDVGGEVLQREANEYKSSESYKNSKVLNIESNIRAEEKTQSKLKVIKQKQKNQLNDFNKFLKEN